MAEDRIIKIDINQEMKSAYIDYSMSVIVSRALPDVRDGFKPVHRRILFGMNELGNTSDKPYKKAARIVGEVLGKYHPHGDSSVYFALVRLAQNWSMRYTLVDGQGNFGSVDGDSPAAMRYTEARMSRLAEEMLRDIDKDTVDFQLNFDDTLQEPTVLPTRIPNLLINGASGIAVGMATNMPPHNMTEVLRACQAYVDARGEIDVEGLMQHVKAPDFPTGATIYGYAGIKEAFETGRGRIVIRGKAEIESGSAHDKIVISEIPYMVNKAELIRAIADLVNEKRLDGVSNVNDESDRSGMRIVVDVKREANANIVLNKLYKMTALQSSFSVNNIALVNGRPKLMNLKDLIGNFVDHRRDVVLRRTRFELKKAEERAHILQGLIIASDHIDEVIAIIRSSDDADVARERLMTAFDLSQAQADYILELRLRRLTKFSRIELEAERDELAARIAELREVLESPELLRALVKRELAEVSERLGTPRRTVLLASSGAPVVGGAGASSLAALPSVPRSGKGLELQIPDDPCQVVLSATGALARVEGADPLEPGPRAAFDGWRAQLPSSVRSQVAVVTEDGVAHRIDVVDLPALPRFDTGMSLAGAVPASELLHSDSRPVGLLDPDGSAVSAMGTARGTVKRLRPDVLQRDEWEVIALDPGDRLIGFAPCPDEADVVFISGDAQLLRTPAERIRPQGRTAGGVAGMRLSPGVEAIGFWVVDAPAESVVVTVAAAEGALPGTGQTTVKVTPFDAYPSKGRGGQGVRAQRFLRGEDRLDVAWVGAGPRASTSDGAPVDLPAPDGRRDGSGSPITLPIATIG